jgi:serine/threonine protein kinase
MDYKTLDNYFYYNKQIAQGSFSVIYRGYNIHDRTPVAIKKIIKQVDEKYINSEIDIMKTLDHINILKLYDVITYKNTLYLVLEYCNKGDLINYIKSSDNTHDIDYIKQILCGLKYLYNNNILHRDIKPQNILINNNIIKICDFGFAKNIKHNDLLSTFCGSPLYMAPEILKYREYTDKSDIWSLGVIIYEIIFKRHPYMSSNHTDLINKIKNEDLIIEDSPLSPLLKRMLVNNPRDRISWVELFSIDWFNNSLVNHKDYFKNINEKNDVDLKFSDIFNSENNEGSDSLMSFSYNDNMDSIYNIDKEDTENKPITIKPNKSLDRKVYPHSAPNETNYLENYIHIKSKSIKSSYKILGTSPKLSNSVGLYSYLNKSVGTIKNFFGT